jgi:hypothetical protein
MPRRPFYPPVALPPDIFGLLHPGVLVARTHHTNASLESEAETRKRVEKGVEAAFKAAIRHLGEEEARRLFARVLRHPKRGQGKMLAPDRDARLLKEYDAAAPKGESVAALARRIHAAVGRELGNTPDAIETQIRKLLKERKQRERAAAVEMRRWRMATRGEQPGVLSANSSRSRNNSLQNKRYVRAASTSATRAEIANRPSASPSTIRKNLKSRRSRLAAIASSFDTRIAAGQLRWLHYPYSAAHDEREKAPRLFLARVDNRVSLRLGYSRRSRALRSRTPRIESMTQQRLSVALPGEGWETWIR